MFPLYVTQSAGSVSAATERTKTAAMAVSGARSERTIFGYLVGEGGRVLKGVVKSDSRRLLETAGIASSLYMFQRNPLFIPDGRHLYGAGATDGASGGEALRRTSLNTIRCVGAALSVASTFKLSSRYIRRTSSPEAIPAASEGHRCLSCQWDPASRRTDIVRRETCGIRMQAIC